MTEGEIFAALLTRRGITDRDRWLQPSYELHLHDPALLPDIKPALKRLTQARDRGETVAIYGDYDIDGLTASTILSDALQAFGFTSFVFIPDRFKDGYGLSRRGVEAIYQQGATLAVTVDCGSRSVDEIAYAKSLGLDVIVTDHHHVGEMLPDAVAMINPKRLDSKYPFKDLAGCGVAFKLVQAMQAKFEGLPVGQEKWLLDLVALGTVCDVVDLVDENRVLVSWGLKVLQRTRRPGLMALAAVSKTPLNEIDGACLGFRFGPRLNAAGRLETAQTGLDLLQTRSLKDAMALAAKLDDMNYQRRTQQEQIMTEALQLAEACADDPVLVLANPQWSHGIVGIVASKLVEKLGKPVFLLQDLGETAKGSARSFGDFHLANALDAVRTILLSGGGHALAAGCSIKSSDLLQFRTALNDYYRTLKLDLQNRFLQSRFDVELPDFRGLSFDLINLLDQLAPFGHGNEQPLFAVKDVSITDLRGVGSSGQHAKVRLRDSLGNVGEGIGFGLAEQLQGVEKPVPMLMHLERNNFNGRSSLQFRVTGLAS